MNNNELQSVKKKKDRKQNGMRNFVNFEKLLLFSNRLATFSGYMCVTIDSKTFEQRKSLLNMVYFGISFALSVVGNFVYSGSYYPVAEITHSKILEFLVNALVFSTIYLVCVFKVFNYFVRKKFFLIFKDLQWCNQKVRQNG